MSFESQAGQGGTRPIGNFNCVREGATGPLLADVAAEVEGVDEFFDEAYECFVSASY